MSNHNDEILEQLKAGEITANQAIAARGGGVKSAQKTAIKYGSNKYEEREQEVLIHNLNKGDTFEPEDLYEMNNDETYETENVNEFDNYSLHELNEEHGQNRDNQLGISTLDEFLTILKFYYDGVNPNNGSFWQEDAFKLVDSRAHISPRDNRRINVGVVIAENCALRDILTITNQQFVVDPVDHSHDGVSFTGIPTDALTTTLLGDNTSPHLQIVCGHYNSERSCFRNFEVKLRNNADTVPFKILNIHLNYPSNQYQVNGDVYTAIVEARQRFV